MTDHDENEIIETIERVPAQEVPLQSASLGTENPQQPSRLDSLTPDQRSVLSLKKRTEQRDMYKARYQALATKLNKLTFQDREFLQVDDSRVIELVESLRVKIWKFSLHHYEGNLAGERGPLPDHFLTVYTAHTLRSDMVLEDYLQIPEWCPRIIEAFLWKIIVKQISNKFWWAGIAGNNMSKVHADMKKSFQQTTAEIQTFQTWSATTSKLIHDAQKRNEPTWSGRDTDALDDLVAKIHFAIHPYRTSKNGDPRKGIQEILHAAIALDEELSQPLAQFEWEFPKAEGTLDPKQMQLAEGDGDPSEEGPISIVISPGLKKQGRSGDFVNVDLLVPIKVSCVPPFSGQTRIQEHMGKIYSMAGSAAGWLSGKGHR
ncbi:hypothetical protein VN97_g11921 [Penicillium thymicola]|uniref:Uncharacterized protein n=1 Tax=Penicillium thymicola TaxID=293382 RepID=A0AAI9T732_PENTH|nr:hypothetical protein VN97_g11921 [Penicillium thymicola]